MTKPTTAIATSTTDDVFLRGKSLTKEIVGKLTFTEAVFFQVLGVMPTEGQTAVLDACLVTLMEHGLTPSALATRLVGGSAPEAMQGAIAAGILGVGSVFVGSVEAAAAVLTRVAASADPAAEAARAVGEQKHMPGFGHPQHKPDDPRPPVLFAIATQHGIAGKHVAALRLVAAAVDAAAKKHVTINATGAIAAVLLDAGVPAGIMRGFAILARCAGLVGHFHEEQTNPAMRAIWEAADQAVPYEPR